MRAVGLRREALHERAAKKRSLYSSIGALLSGQVLRVAFSRQLARDRSRRERLHEKTRKNGASLASGAGGAVVSGFLPGLASEDAVRCSRGPGA